MKKGTMLLVVALVFALAVPGMAAVEFHGKIGSAFEVTRDDTTNEWELEGHTGIELETALRSEGGHPVKAVVKLKPWELKGGFDDDGNPVGDFDRTGNPLTSNIDLTVDKAWIETEGAYWDGGPKVKTRIGDVNVEWDNYIAHLGDRAGVTMDGLTVGPVTARTFYAWDASNDTRPMGLAARASIDRFDVEGRVIHRVGEQNASLAASVDVIDGVEVGGFVAIDSDRNPLYKVHAEADGLVNGVKLTAAYRGAHDDFEPMYTRTHDGDGNELYDKLTGFSVGMETMQKGIELKADYDDPKKQTDVKAATNFEGFDIEASTRLISTDLDEAKVKIGRHVDVAGFDIHGEYEAKIKPGNNMEHLVKASTRTDMVPYLSGLDLSGQVKLVGNDVSWKTAADYNAPNGIALGVAYDSVEGPSATAGVTVEF